MVRSKTIYTKRNKMTRSVLAKIVGETKILKVFVATIRLKLE